MAAFLPMQLHQQTRFGPARRGPDELTQQPDVVGVGRVGQKRKHVLDKLRDVHGFQLRKNSVQISAASTTPRVENE